MGVDDRTAKPRAGARPGVLCAKCDHLNPAENTTCSRCGAHLYLACHRCGHSNRRVSARCSRCGARLHRSFWHRWQKRVALDKFKLKPLQIVLLLVVAFVVYRVIVMLAEYSPSPSM